MRSNLQQVGTFMKSFFYKFVLKNRENSVTLSINKIIAVP